uniref:Aldehyde dehydrogenase n=1 Tax=Eptatretus burgeri TaxID=7764 RepID=A0A8C4NAN1_EPTBU
MEMEVVERVREGFFSGKTKPFAFRQQQLQRLLELVEDNEDVFSEVLHKDLHKSKFETLVTEVNIIRNETVYALHNLKDWMKPENVKKEMLSKMDECFVQREPFGVVLIIGAWNYPLHLTLVPLVGAIAAGNCVVIKPSDLSTATSELISTLIPQYLDQDCYGVVCGGAKDTSELLKNNFDYIFYTGGSTVGKLVMQAAAEHLTPITLELGGKNPCFVDQNCDLRAAARRIAWGRFLNAGQTCIAPDFVLCTDNVCKELVQALKESVRDYFGEDPQKSPDYGRIINECHFARLERLLSRGTVAVGGRCDAEDKYIAPTVLLAEEQDPAMQEEIFGPILPIMTVPDLDYAIKFINRGQKPLALYAFTKDRQVMNTLLRETSSGTFCGNDCIMQTSLITLPFGGVGRFLLHYSGLCKLSLVC